MLRSSQGLDWTREHYHLFQGNKNIFGISPRKQGISLQFKGTFTSNFWEQWDILKGNKGEKWHFQGSREHAIPPSGRPSKITKSKLFITANYRMQYCIVLTCHHTNFQKKQKVDLIFLTSLVRLWWMNWISALTTVTQKEWRTRKTMNEPPKP